MMETNRQKYNAITMTKYGHLDSDSDWFASIPTYFTGRRNSCLRRCWPFIVLILGGLCLLAYHYKTCPCFRDIDRLMRTQSQGMALHRHPLSKVWQVADEEDGEDDEEQMVFQVEENRSQMKPLEGPLHIRIKNDKKPIPDDLLVIVNSVLKAGNVKLKEFTGKLSCKGDRLLHEVEDILCIPRPKFLENIRNPCWWESTPGEPTGASKLRCLPKFHILGCEKCGSSDLWQRITSHPHTVKIVGTKSKESNWWGWKRYGIYANRTAPIRNFTGYTDSFKPIVKKLEQSLMAGGDDHRLLITEDGTPSDFWDFRGWRNISQNRGLQTPVILTPHLMKHFYPHPKFLVIFRNPVERLYSDYYFTSHGTDATGFHKAVVKAIGLVASCLRQYTVQQCFFSRELYASLPVRFHYLFYSVYIREWLQVFPRENFLFFKTEEYEMDPIRALRMSFKFIGLQPLNQTRLESIASLDRFRVGTKRQEAGDMLPSTRKLLEAIARPCNKQFAKIMGDNKFAWD